MVNLIHPTESSGESAEPQREQQPATKDNFTPARVDAILQGGRKLPANITEDLLERATTIVVEEGKATREEIAGTFTAQAPTLEQQQLRARIQQVLAVRIEDLPRFIVTNREKFSKLHPRVRSLAEPYAVDAALMADGRGLDSVTFHAIHAQESRARRPEDERLIQQYDYQLAKVTDNITNANSALNSLRDLRDIYISQEDKDAILAAASGVVGEKLHIPPSVLIGLGGRLDPLGWWEEDFRMEALPLERVASACKSLEQEWGNRMDQWKESWLETDLDRIEDLIDRVKVDARQKEEWRRMAKLDLPKDARIHVIPLIGGTGLPLSGEELHMKSGIVAGRDDGKITFAPVIDNTKLSKQEILQRIREEMETDADIILFYDSSHGLTASRPGLEYTHLGEADDTFAIAGEKEISRERLRFLETVRDDIVAQARQRAGEGYFRDPQGRPMSHENWRIDIGPIHKTVNGQTLTLEHRTLRLKDGVKSWEDFGKVVLTYLKFHEENISSEELRALQKDSLREAPGKRFGYIFDACFSGSAVDDPLAEEEGTLMILHSSQATEPSQVDPDNPGRSTFSHEFFRYLQQGDTWGEAFVRADIRVNYGRQRRYNNKGELRQWQNPGASVRLPDGQMLRVSSVLDTPQKTEPNQERGLA